MKNIYFILFYFYSLLASDLSIDGGSQGHLQLNKLFQFHALGFHWFECSCHSIRALEISRFEETL